MFACGCAEGGSKDEEKGTGDAEGAGGNLPKVQGVVLCADLVFEGNDFGPVFRHRVAGMIKPSGL